MIAPGVLAVPCYNGERVGSSEAMVVVERDDIFSTVLSIEAPNCDVRIVGYCTTHVQEHAIDITSVS